MPQGSDLRTTTEPRRWSVRTYLVAMLLLAVAARAGMVGYGFWSAAGTARTAALMSDGETATRAVRELSNGLDDGKATVAGLVGQPQLAQAFGPVGGDCQLTASGAGAFTSVRLDLVRADGRVTCSSDTGARVHSGEVHRGSRWLTTGLRASGTSVLWDAVDPVTRSAAIVVTAPVRSGTATVGVVALFLHLPAVAETLRRDWASATHESVTVLDRTRGVLLASTERPPSGQARPVPRSGRGEWRGSDGVMRLYASKDLAGELRVLVGVSSHETLAAARTQAWRQGALGLVTLAILAVLAWLFDRRVAGPLRAATQAAIAAGRSQGTRLRETGTAELVMLAREFNRMLDLRAGHDAQRAFQASHDEATGLPNRGAVLARLDELLRQSDLRGQVAVLKLGLNRFKLVNDTLGREIGDDLLGELGARLKDGLTPDEVLGRGDGDGFIVVVVGATRDSLAARARRLLQTCEAPFEVQGGEIALHPNVGVTLCAPAESTAGQLLREADHALRHAKATRQDWSEFDRVTQQDPRRDIETEVALRAALEQGELRVHYQPLVEAMTGRVVGAEALVRWVRPGRGLVPPVEFVPLAEATGQIVAIGEVVLREACQQLVRWEADGHRLEVSVNVAVRQLRDPQFPGLVADVLRDSGLEASRLCLELTESALVNTTGQESAALEELREIGVRLSIDDFGTGFSSLAYLHQIPATELKIDRAFTGRLGHDPRQADLVEGIVRMAHALHLVVVVEGVETERQLHILREVGCDVVQGFLISRPVTAEEFLLFLQDASRPAVA